MVAEHKIDRQKLISGHNPVLTEIATDSPLTVGNGELAFTADITGMQTLYEEYQELPLCTMSQWGWHTKPVSREKYNYTLDDLVMTEYVNREGRLLKYPQDKKVGNEDVYNWLRENPHRLNLVRVRLQWEEESISAEDITGVRQELVLYEGILYSEFQIRNNACRVRTACHNEGRDILAFSLESEALKEKKISIVLDFPYGASDITASDWTQNDRHRTTILQMSDEKMLLWRQLDRDLCAGRKDPKGRQPYPSYFRQWRKTGHLHSVRKTKRAGRMFICTGSNERIQKRGWAFLGAGRYHSAE